MQNPKQKTKSEREKKNLIPKKIIIRIKICCIESENSHYVPFPCLAQTHLRLPLTQPQRPSFSLSFTKSTPSLSSTASIRLLLSTIPHVLCLRPSLCVVCCECRTLICFISPSHDLESPVPEATPADNCRRRFCLSKAPEISGDSFRVFGGLPIRLRQRSLFSSGCRPFRVVASLRHASA